jgi:hypothetical protein
MAADELIISPRDREHPALAEFVSPFVFDSSKAA